MRADCRQAWAGEFLEQARAGPFILSRTAVSVRHSSSIADTTGNRQTWERVCDRRASGSRSTHREGLGSSRDRDAILPHLANAFAETRGVGAVGEITGADAEINPALAQIGALDIKMGLPKEVGRARGEPRPSRFDRGLRLQRGKLGDVGAAGGECRR